MYRKLNCFFFYYLNHLHHLLDNYLKYNYLHYLQVTISYIVSIVLINELKRLLTTYIQNTLLTKLTSATLVNKVDLQIYNNIHTQC